MTFAHSFCWLLNVDADVDENCNHLLAVFLLLTPLCAVPTIGAAGTGQIKAGSGSHAPTTVPWGHSTKFYTGRFRLIPFFDKRVPFSYTRHWQMVPLWHTNCSLELCIPFDCCKYTVYKIRVNHKTRKLSWLFHSHKILRSGSPFRSSVTDWSDSFPYPFIYFNYWNPYPFINVKHDKSIPYGLSLPV